MPDSQDRRNELNARLKEKLLQHCRGTCNLLTSIEGFHLVRRDVQKKPENCFEKPLAGLVIQGTKHSLIGGKDYVYTENQSIVAGVDMPIASYITAPTPEHPFLFLYLYLNRETLTDLVAKMGEISGGEEEETDSGLTIADTDEDIMEMFLRLMELLDKPEQISVRGPDAAGTPLSPAPESARKKSQASEHTGDAEQPDCSGRCLDTGKFQGANAGGNAGPSGPYVNGEPLPPL